jgi:hypothetical protein
MKLNKKYCNLVDSDSGYDNQLLADCCENVADEFAIGFAEWAIAKNMGVSKFTLYEGELEIYKKEKGL